MRRTLAAVGITFVASLAAAAGQDAADAVGLFTRAGGYVRARETQILSLAGVEQQIQHLVRGNGTVRRTRTIESDIIFVRIGRRPYLFRDVAVVDGKAVRNRDARLQTFFAAKPRTIPDQVQRIVAESARYDLDFPRFQFLSAVLLPLTMVAGRPDRYRLIRTPDGVSLEEARSPTIYQQRGGGPPRDMPLSGQLTIDASTGSLSAASLQIRGDEIEAQVEATYAEAGDSKLFAPRHVSETYRRARKPKDDHLEVATDYVNMRQFVAAVDERTTLPN